MKRVFLPRTLDELWRILDEEPRAAVYAGGTDLLVRLRGCVIHPTCLVCLERIDELKGVAEKEQDILIGPCTTLSDLAESPLISTHFPVLKEALEGLGSPPIRNMARSGAISLLLLPRGTPFLLSTSLGAGLSSGKRNLCGG